MLAPEILLDDEIEDVGAACLRPLGIDYDVIGSAALRAKRSSSAIGRPKESSRGAALDARRAAERARLRSRQPEPDRV